MITMKMIATKVLWFTGLSGSGKSTLADALHETLVSHGKRVLILDGDAVRERFHTHLGFTPEDIMENNHLIQVLCKEAVDSNQYDFVLVPVIAPFLQSRQAARKLLGESYVEIFVDASFEECTMRDVKGLYAKALRGEIDHFIGLDPRVPYERPEESEIHIDTTTVSVDMGKGMILDFLKIGFD